MTNPNAPALTDKQLLEANKLLEQAIDLQIGLYNNGHIDRTKLIVEIKSIKTFIHSQEIRALNDKIRSLHKELTEKDILLDSKISIIRLL